jgi:hypothetical protein
MPADDLPICVVKQVARWWDGEPSTRKPPEEIRYCGLTMAVRGLKESLVSGEDARCLGRETRGPKIAGETTDAKDQ